MNSQATLTSEVLSLSSIGADSLRPQDQTPLDSESFSPDDHFRANVIEALGRFRQAMERMVYSFTKSLKNSRDLQGLLGVDRNVSWQIFKLLGPIETIATVSYIPAAISLKKVLAAAKKKMVAQEDLDEVAASFAAFEKLVDETTGDREEFESVVMSYSGSAESVQIGMQHRKASFKADSHFIGVAVDTLIFSLFFHPGLQPETVDFCAVRQMLGMRRLRASTDVVVDRFKFNADRTDRAGDFLLSDALDLDAASRFNAAVLPEFCSQPILPLVTQIDEAGDIRTLLKHRDIGIGREVDITTARVLRGMPLFRTPDGRPIFDGLVEVGRPTRVQVIDTFVHRPSWPDLVPTSGVFVHLPRRVVAKVDQEAVRLPSFTEKLKFMGSGTDVMRVGESPSYPSLIKHACQKMGWNYEDMDLYRIRHEFPLMDSNVLCRLEAMSPR